MPKIGEDNWYFDRHKKYLKYAHTPQKEKEFTSFQIREKIEKVFEEVFSSDILADLFPECIDVTNEFIAELKNAVIENELQQMYEFLKFSQSYYLREEIHPYAITHEIIYQSIHGKPKNELDYNFRYSDGNKIDIHKIKEIQSVHKDGYDFTNKNYEIADKEKELYSTYFSEIKQSITNRITKNIKSANIIRPYQLYLIDEETDGIYKNYCKLFMEIYCPSSKQRVQAWINPASILNKDKNIFCIAALIQDYDELIEAVDVGILQRELKNDKLPDLISEIKKYQKKISKKTIRSCSIHTHSI